MTSSRKSPWAPALAAVGPSGFCNAWASFWFLPRQLLALHSLRVIFSLLALWWLLPLASEVESFFGTRGWFDGPALAEAQAMQQRSIDQERAREAGENTGQENPAPPVPVDLRSWSLLYAAGGSAAGLQALYWGSVAAVGLFGLGIAVRVTGPLSWLAVVTFSDNPLIEGDPDVFLRMMAFYLMIGYLFAGQSRSTSWLSRAIAPLDYWILAGKQPAARSSAATLALRLLQIHFAVAVVTSGVHKLQMAEWWNGVALWYLLSPAAEATSESLQRWAQHRDFYLILISLATYAVLVWQIAFPAFAWRPGRWRVLLVGGGFVGCLGLMFLMNIPLMGQIFLVLCLAYVQDEEWNALLEPALSRMRREG